MSEQFNANDQHYASKDIEPILVQEQIMETVSEVPAKARLCIAQALRYLMRAGTKQGEDWKKELSKAENYIHRARTGEWIKPQSEPLSPLEKTRVEDIAKTVIAIQSDVSALGITNGVPIPIELSSEIQEMTEEGKKYFVECFWIYNQLKPSTQTKESTMATTKKATAKKTTKKPAAKKAVKKPVAAKLPKAK